MNFHKEGGAIHSDEGWALQPLSRVRMRYTDGERQALLGCEWPFGKRGIVSYVDKVRTWSVPAGVDMTADERAVVIKRVTAALEWQGLTVHT